MSRITIVSNHRDADVVTHDGGFHADEVMACAMMLIGLRTLNVRRTRDLSVIKDAIIHGKTVVDVGGENKPDLDAFDHHQKGGAGGRKNGVPYSSFGLLWKKRGVDTVIAAIPNMTTLTTSQAVAVADAIDDGLVTTVDATDNGAVFGYQTLRNSPDVRIPQYSVSLMIHHMNPPAFGVASPVEYDAAFCDAVEFAAGILRREIEHTIARVISETRVRDAIREAADAKVLILEQFEAAWSDIAVESPSLLYCVFPDQRGTWMVQQVAKTKGSFEGRAPLPEAWAGLRDQQLAAITGVNDAVFCHNGRFIAGAKSKDGAIAMAALAVSAFES